MSYNSLQNIRNELKQNIEHLKRKKELCQSNKTISNYINGEIAGIGIAIHQIESEIYEMETDVFTQDPK